MNDAGSPPGASARETHFRFLGPGGRTTRRSVYWEDLHVFSTTDDRVVVAARTVPHAGLFAALYSALRSRRGPGLSETLLAGPTALPGAGAISLALHPSEEDAVLLREVRALVRDALPESPFEVLARAEARMDEEVSRSLAARGIEQGLDFFSDASAVDEVERRLRDPSDALNALVQAEDARTGWVALSFEVDRAIKRALREQLQASQTLPGIVRFGDLEQDLRLRLYTDARYLRFLRRVLDAPGSFASPAARDFLSFYVEALNRRLAAAARDTGESTAVVRKRLETYLGRQQPGPHYVLVYKDLTILGCPVQGELPIDRADPDVTGSGYRVDGGRDFDDLVLVEVRGTVRRFVVRRLVWWSFGTHHNVERVAFVDET